MSRSWKRYSALAALAAPLLLGACGAFRIHDEGRAKLAAAGKQSYTDAKVPEVIEADRKNLELLLGEEIKVVRDNFALQVNFAALEIANNATPMADTYGEATVRLNELGFKTPAVVREFVKRVILARSHERTLASNRKVFVAASLEPPSCDGLSAEPVLPKSLDEKRIATIKEIYPAYREQCEKLLANSQPPKGGLLESAYAEWKAAKSAADKRRTEQQRAVQDLQSAQTEYESAVAKGAEGEGSAGKIAEKAEALRAALTAAGKVGLGADNDANIKALVDLLTAAAGGEVKPADKGVARAAIVAKEIPSLTDDIRNLQAKATRPPVSGLLVALRHQTILAEDAKKRAALADERVNVLKARYDAYYVEAERWLQFTDAVCSYAFRTAGKAPSGKACDELGIEKSGKCTLDKCGLAAPWNKALRANANQRELYKAVAAYLQAIALQARPEEERFREVDVRHREALLAKKSAIEAWDNLASGPIDQLNTFYQTGIKPAEISDLIIKALGFTAIAIGVAQ